MTMAGGRRLDGHGSRRPQWTAGEVPWVRHQVTAGRRATCYFCGGQTLIQSNHDKSMDYGRIELYCDSPDCDAREVVVLAIRGERAHLRADVRALKLVDSIVPPAEPEPDHDSDGDFDDYSASDPDSAWFEEIQNRRHDAMYSSDEATRRRFSDAKFSLSLRDTR